MWERKRESINWLGTLIQILHFLFIALFCNVFLSLKGHLIGVLHANTALFPNNWKFWPTCKITIKPLPHPIVVVFYILLIIHNYEQDQRIYDSFKNHRLDPKRNKINDTEATCVARGDVNDVRDTCRVRMDVVRKGADIANSWANDVDWIQPLNNIETHIY